MKNDYNAKAFFEYIKTFKIDYETITYPDFKSIFIDLQKNNISAGVINSTPGSAYQLNYNVKKTNIIFNPFDIHFAVQEGAVELNKTLESRLKDFKDDNNSVYYSGLRSWLKRNIDFRESVPKIYFFILIGLVSIVLFFLVFILLLRHLVSLRTRELSSSQKGFKSLFENSPIPLWEEDFSEVKKYIEALKEKGIEDLKKYFIENNNEVKKCSTMVKIVRFNKAVLDLHDAKTEVILLEGLTSIFTEKSYIAFSKQLFTIIDKKNECEINSIVKTLNGVEKNVSVKWQVVLGHETTLNKVYISTVDITKLKQAEKKMHFLSSITEKMHESIVVTDLQGHITYINKSAEKLFGYTLEELIGQSPALFNIDPQADKIQNELYESIGKGKVYQGEVLNQKKDGSEFICEFTVAPITDENGGILSYLGTQRDITEIRNLENASIKQERLSAIGELASGIAHDFNNALQIILGGVELALVSEEPEELNEYLESIKLSAKDAASRVRQLQRFSQKNNMPQEVKLININKLAEDVVKETKLLISQYQEKGIHIEIKSVFMAKSNIEGSEGELRSCLFNLIKNSTEAMPKGGKITISTDECEDNIYVNVCDTGIGMNKDTEKKIFQPFYTTKGFEPGRGLGMAQVYSAIRDHNGQIYVKESKIGKGTNIEFTIPVSKKELILEKKEEDYVGTANILWVDDEEMILTLVKNMLVILGHTVDLASNGNKALEFLAKGNRYDLIITDIGMPGMSGWELLEEILKIRYVTKFAVVTGWGADVPEENKRKYNVDYVLGKPIDIKNLKALIGVILQNKNDIKELE